MQLKKENAQSTRHLVQVKQELAGLQHELNTVRNDTFYKEKIAREQLQMARLGDQIFYLM